MYICIYIYIIIYYVSYLSSCCHLKDLTEVMLSSISLPGGCCPAIATIDNNANGDTVSVSHWDSHEFTLTNSISLHFIAFHCISLHFIPFH